MFLTEEGLKNSSAKLVQKGDILYALYGATSGETGLAQLDGAINQAILDIRPHENYDAQFIMQWLRKSKGSIIGTYLQGGQGNLSGTIVTSLLIECPTYEEQKKIGECFKTLDNTITLHQCKHYQGHSSIFAPQKASDIALFTATWEQRKLGDMATFAKGKGYSKSDLCDDGNPIILYGRLYTKYETVISEVDTFAEAKDGSVYSVGGEVIVPASGETAEEISIASVVANSGVLLGGDLNVISPSDSLDPAFLAISITYGNPHNEMAKLAQGKTVVHLHNDDLKKIDLLFPTLEEQRRIRDVFYDIDNIITLHQRDYLQ